MHTCAKSLEELWRRLAKTESAPSRLVATLGRLPVVQRTAIPFVQKVVHPQLARHPRSAPSAAAPRTPRPVVPPSELPISSSRKRLTAGLAQTAPKSVTNGTTSRHPAPNAVASTSVHSAEIAIITPGHAPNSPFRIVTPFKLQQWHDTLQQTQLQDEFQDVLHGIQYGFRTGVTSTLTSTFTPQNHSSALIFAQQVSQHISTELKVGRYSGPFSFTQLIRLIGHFKTAPFGVVPKPHSNSYRVIRDLSYPRNNPTLASVNSEINSDDFPCEWGTFAQCFFTVAKAPPGTQVAVFDVESAYRNIPISPLDQPHFCVRSGDDFFIDHCAAFGSASSCGMFGRVADAFVAILKKFGAEVVLKWVDDIIFFRFPTAASHPYSYAFDASLIFSIAGRLGWPWSIPKNRAFSSVFTYLGFLWNIPSKTVQIPASKKDKYIARCRSFLAASKQSLKSSQQLLGTLNHCCLAIRFARTHIHALRSFVAKFPVNSSPFITHTVPASIRNEIHWWSATLSQEFVGSTIATPPAPLNIDIFVDASTSWGIGVLINGKWAAWRFSSDALQHGRAIGWAEMVAVELAVSVLCSVYPKHSHFLIHSDNQGVIGAIESGSSRGPSQNASLSRICSKLLLHDSFLSTKYIASSSNPSDSLSRGILPPKDSSLRTSVILHPSVSHFLTRM